MCKSSSIVMFLFACVLAVTSRATEQISTQPSTVSSNPSSKEQPVAKINLNTATAKQLQQIKGIGVKTSQAIINYRTSNGNFATIDDILNARCHGINKNWLEKTRSQLTV